jgi:hypothetical protein
MLPAHSVGTLYGGCVWDASAYRVISAGLTNLNTARLHRLVTVAAVFRYLQRYLKMKTWNQFLTERYRPLESNLTDSKPLIIDTTANPQDILECAVQRLRASSDLLKTLYCLNFKQADVEDIPHITHALYLLTQDGCDLLQVAQQQMLNWKAPA